MGAEDALAIAERLIYKKTNRGLDDLARQIFKRAWNGERDRDIAEAMDYDESYVRDRGSQLFRLLSQALVLYLAATYRNAGEIYRSFDIYRSTIIYCESNHFTQIKANALHGMAQLYRVQETFESALSHHALAIDLLTKIGAKCDLAEAYLQLGLTHHAVGRLENRQTAFDRARQLFDEIQAPLHLDRIQRILNTL